MRLLVGLGNPEPRHAKNRHNIGFMAVDALVRRHEFAPFRSKFSGAYAEGTIGGERVIALKPMTFMNLSGDSVGACARFYKVDPVEIAVIHDELDLAPGKLRVKRGGGTAGHNGLRSIDDAIGPDFWRVRVGIGHPGVKELVLPYVLQNFDADEMTWVTPLVDAIAEALPLLVKDDAPGFMTKVALILKPPPPKPPRPATKPDTESNGI
ncbi:MAG TPA: aminoacyl-tRNA hydrolase [Stellaceae bacterium]|nr:aminoacyl-tRNA hydrolase [Stellaceae bacterium]